jgi:DNA-binding NtrC family response regulator
MADVALHTLVIDDEDGIRQAIALVLRQARLDARTVTSLALHELAFAEAKRRVVEEFTSAYVQALLTATNHNVSEAARRSGLDRSNFRRLLKKRA